MRIRPLLLLVPTPFLLSTLLRAAEDAKPIPGRAVGSVYGQAITAADIGLTAPIDQDVRFDARDTAQWKQMGRIMTTFGTPVVERFVKRQKIEATDDEIKRFKIVLRKLNERNLREWNARLLELKQQLAAPNLSDEEKEKLQEQQAMYEKFVASAREPGAGDGSNEVACLFIVGWKTERELLHKYGGRVIFQQAGPEALDARRRLFEEAERNGDLTFDDAGVRHLFYYYANMKHTVVGDEALDKPWFLDDAILDDAADPS